MAAWISTAAAPIACGTTCPSPYRCWISVSRSVKVIARPSGPVVMSQYQRPSRANDRSSKNPASSAARPRSRASWAAPEWLVTKPQSLAPAPTLRRNRAPSKGWNPETVTDEGTAEIESAPSQDRCPPCAHGWLERGSTGSDWLDQSGQPLICVAAGQGLFSLVGAEGVGFEPTRAGLPP